MNRVASVLDALAIIDQRLGDTDKLVVPSVLDELAFLCDSAQSLQLRQTSRQAIKLIREEGRFRPLLELPFPPETVETLAGDFHKRQLLPPEEMHDAARDQTFTNAL